MANADKLGRLKDNLVLNLDKKQLKKYLFYLTKKYYESYMKGDEKGFHEVMDKIIKIIDEYNEDYINLRGFIYYCFYLNSILIISDKSGDKGFPLQNIAKYDLMEDDDFDDELHHDIKNIFNKDRIRKRYYEKGID